MANLALKGHETSQTFGAEAQECPKRDLKSATPQKRRATGPGTDLGRKKPSRNAVTHGIFSSIVVLPGEPEKLYGKLLRDLLEDLQPVGRAEKLLVEKLAVDAWRLRRLGIVEGAEIRLSTEFYMRDREAEQAREIRDVEAGLTGVMSLAGGAAC